MYFEEEEELPTLVPINRKKKIDNPQPQETEKDIKKPVAE